MKKKSTLVLLVCFCFATGLFAQKTIYGTYKDSYGKDYIIKMNPKNGSIKKVAKLGKIVGFVTSASAYDDVNGRYFLEVQTDTGSYLDICNVNTGTVNNVSIAAYGFPQFFQYDPVSSQLYGIKSDSGKMFVCSIDTTNGHYSKIGSYAINACTYSSFDHVHGYYIMIGVVGGGHPEAMAMDVSSGNVVYNVALDTLNGLMNASYSQADGKIYGVTYDFSNKTEYFLSVDLSSGHYTTIASTKKIFGVAYTDAAFDDINGRLTFYGIDTAGRSRIYTLDVSTNSVLYQPKIPKTLLIYEFHCDVSASSSLSDYDVLGGTIGSSSGNAETGATVYMYDTKGNVIDSMINDGYGDYMFSQPAGSYYVCASPASSSANQLSTYYGSTISINKAKAISVSGDITTTNFNTMGAAAPSTGSISGTVMLSQTCDGNPGNMPATGVKLFLADNSGNPEYETVSDAKGNFIFNDIAVQPYQIQVDNISINNSEAPTVSLTSSKTNITDISLNMCTDKLALAGSASGIKTVSSGITSVNIYPNPFSSVLNINYQLNTDDKTEIIITDINGKELYHNTKISDLSGLHHLSISSTDIGLKPGIYLVTFKTSLNSQIEKIVNL